MPEPEVVRAAREFKAALLAREKEQVAVMVRAWLTVERALERQIADLAAEIEAMRQRGEKPSLGKVKRLERYRQLLVQTQRQVSQYEAWAERVISAGQREMAQLGLWNAEQLIGAQIGVDFNRLPYEAVQNIVGITADGAPLFDLLKQRALWPASVQGLMDALRNAIAMGWNPRKTALRMKDGLAEGLTKALVIARTEQLRAYRIASVAEYRESGVVSGFRRLAAKDDRTCLGCLMADGEVIPLGQELGDHPAGRCTCIPIVKGAAPIEYQTGREWFEGLRPDQQAEMMGEKMYQAWRDGKFDLPALTKRTRHRVWGPGIAVTPLGELMAG